VTAAELVGLVAQLLYVAVFLRVLIDVVRRPRRANVDALLFFGILAVIVVVAEGMRALGVELGKTATLVLVAVVLALPYALLRLADDYRGVRAWVKIGSLAGLVVSIAAFALTPAPYPPALSLLLVAYFVVVLGYCASVFGREAVGSPGVTRRRMRAIALGAALFAVTIALSGVRAFLPAELHDLAQILSSLASLGSGISFFVGFAPPAALLRFWREALLRGFIQTVARLGDVSDMDRVVHRLERAAGVVMGVGTTTVTLGSDSADALPTTPGASLAAPIRVADRVIGVITVQGSRPSLFASDDLQVLTLLADQCAIALENARLLAEIRALHAEEKRSSENRIRAMVDASLDAVVGMNERGDVIEWNHQATLIFGWSRSEALGRQFVDLVIPATQRAGQRDALYRGASAAGGERVELEAVHRSGHEFPIELSITPAQTSGGRIYSAFIRDITERRNAARQRAELDARLRQSERLESLGRLAGGVAHDLNNILAITSNYASFLEERFPPGDPGREDVAQIQRAAERGATFTKQLLTFARRGAVQPTELQLGALLGDLRSMLGRTLLENITFDLRVAPDLWSVMADRGQIEQLVLNLVVNAGDAMPDGGRLVVEANNVEYDEETAAQHLDLRPGRYVLLAVTDTGQGMPPEVIARAFEPFFTTKPKGKGTGLGLATVYGVVQQAGGRVSIYSDVGRGTTVRVFLPATTRSAETAAETPTEPEPARRGAVVLLVEDEDAVREAARRILSAAGYEVLTAPNGDAALSLCAAHTEPIDLLLTDIVMPGISGRELSRRLRAARPDMGVVYMSGYAEDVAMPNDGLDGPLVAKPFTRRPLLEAVAHEINGVPV